MRHVPDGVLRRLDDEPLAVPDRVTDHVAACERCSARRAEIARDTERAAALFVGPAARSRHRPSRGRGCSVSWSATDRWSADRRRRPAAVRAATRAAPERVAAGRAGHRRDRASWSRARLPRPRSPPFSRRPTSPAYGEPERPAGDRRLHRPGRQPRARRLLHRELGSSTAAVRNDHVVLGHRAARRPRSPQAAAEAGFAGPAARPPPRGCGPRPAVRRAAARDGHRDLQLQRRGPRRQLGDPRRRAGRPRAVRRGRRPPTCRPLASRRCAVRPRAPPVRA